MSGAETGPKDEGASGKELLIEAARRNNVDLLEEVLASKSVDLDILNNATDALGNAVLHVAAQYGSLEVLDHLLDQEGLEVDPLNKMEQETPLHKAVEYAKKDKEHGKEIVELLIDAGADPRIRNKRKLKPIDLVDPRNKDLREVLQKAEYAINMGDDVVEDDDEDDGPASDDD